MWGDEFGELPWRKVPMGEIIIMSSTQCSWQEAECGRRHPIRETGEFGYFAALDNVHLHDLHGTIPHLLGLDHTRLTYKFLIETSN